MYSGIPIDPLLAAYSSSSADIYGLAECHPDPSSYPPSTLSSTASSSVDIPLSTHPKLSPRDSSRSAARITIAHPYARLYAKKDSTKRRKIWNHVLEKQLFSPQELSTMGAPHRRTIYIASLEAHIDRLHNHLLSSGLYPIPFNRLEPYCGLNSKTAKSMVAGLQHDATQSKLKLLELERSNTNLRKFLGKYDPNAISLSHSSAPSTLALEADVRRHSVDSSGIGMGTHTNVNHGNYCSYYP